MIVDTSALIAVLKSERGHEGLRIALLTNDGLLPAPVLVEFLRVSALVGNKPSATAEQLLTTIKPNVLTESFTAVDASLAGGANPLYGTGNGRGGTLNLLDLMVYGMARRTGRPILCTGGDFAATDAAIHSASRID